MQLSEALAAYLTQLQADGRAIHTIQQARRHARMLIDALGDPEAERLTHAEVARFLASDKVHRTRTACGRPTASIGMRASESCMCCWPCRASA